MLDMVLRAYHPAPLTRCYAALIGMLARMIAIKVVPEGAELWEKLDEDFWTR